MDNLVQGCMLAAEALTEQKGCIAAGSSYFLHDHDPGVTSRVNQFEFLRPLVEGLGYRHPTAAVPASAALCAAWLLEWLHWLLWPVCDISRWFILTRTEVTGGVTCVHDRLTVETPSLPGLLDPSQSIASTSAANWQVLKSSRTHWMSCARARKELGYRPRRYPFQPVVQWFLERGHGRRSSGGSSGGGVRFAALLAAVLAALLGIAWAMSSVGAAL